MSLVPLTERQQTQIVNNVIAACKDIEKLTKTGYNFLYQCAGFIAHYDINGFKSYYGNQERLTTAILDRASMNQWRNFRPGERDYEYYNTKAKVYNKIVEQLNTFN